MTNKPQKDAIISHWASLVAQALKNQPANAGDSGSIPGSGRYPGEGNDNSLQYSYLENFTDKGAGQTTVHRVAKESDMTEETEPYNTRTLDDFTNIKLASYRAVLTHDQRE